MNILESLFSDDKIKSMTIKKGTINSDETIDNKRKIDTNIILTVEYYDDEDKKTSNNKKIKFDEYMKNWLYNFDVV